MRNALQHWEKQGLIYATSAANWWDQSHAQVPVVDMVNDEIWRIYYCTRDAHGKSRTSFLEVEAGAPENILYHHPRPILELGDVGTFDDSGIMPSWVVNHDSKKYLFYIGWTTRATVPYHNSICLAESTDGGCTFTKVGEGPLFGPSLHEPYFTGTSCVLIEDGIWKNWYLSATKWVDHDGKLEPYYHFKYSESKDGISWTRNGEVAMELKEGEGGLAKASVIREVTGYKMWYSYRGESAYRNHHNESYRIGYAESDDGRKWTRRDDLAGIRVSNEGWDSEMIAYPHVIEYGDTYFMFYNGNGFGTSGFGYATSPV